MAEKTSSRTSTALSNDFGEQSNYGPVRRLDPDFEPKLSQFPTTDVPSAPMSVDNASSPAAHIQDNHQSDIVSTIKPQDTVIKSSDKQSKNIDRDQLKSTNMLSRVVTNINARINVRINQYARIYQYARINNKYTEAEVTGIAWEKSATVLTERQLRETVYEVLTGAWTERDLRENVYNELTGVCPVPIDLKLVLPNLYLGSIDSVFDANCRLVADKEISHLVLCSELEPVDDLVNSLYEKCPAIHILVIAHEDFVQFKFSCEFLRFVHEGRDGENRACIVCDADMLGISGLLLCVYTMIINRTGLETAIKSVKGAHEDFCPAELQLRRFDAAMPLVMQSDEVREFVDEYKRPNDIMEMDDLRFQKANLNAYYAWFGEASENAPEGFDVYWAAYGAWLAVRDVFNESIKRDDAIVCRRRRKSVDIGGGFQSRPSTPVAASSHKLMCYMMLFVLFVLFVFMIIWYLIR